jgi:hypothetical protein
VGGQQDRRLFEVGQAMDQLVKLTPGVRVESRRRLVEEEQLGPSDDADRDIEAATLPTGQGTDLLVRLLTQTDHGDQLFHVVRPGALGCGVRRVVAPQVGEELPWRPARVVTPGLEHHTDARSPVLVALRRIDSQHINRAGRGQPEAFENLDRRGFSGPIRPEQSDDLTPVHGEVDTI